MSYCVDPKIQLPLLIGLLLVQDKQPSSEVPLLERFRKVSAVLRKHTLGIHIDKDANWQTIILEPSIYNAILTILCESFNLEPRLQWKEALRVSFLSKVPQRIRLFYQPVWEQVKDTFESREVDEAEIYSAAWQLIFDSWLYVFEYYSSPEESIFRHLADITGKSDIPALRVAHCIRDIAYGDTSRVNELRSMIESTDPNYQSIFEDSPKLIKSISHSTEFGVQKTIEGDEEHIIIV